MAPACVSVFCWDPRGAKRHTAAQARQLSERACVREQMETEACACGLRGEKGGQGDCSLRGASCANISSEEPLMREPLVTHVRHINTQSQQCNLRFLQGVAVSLSRRFCSFCACVSLGYFVLSEAFSHKMDFLQGEKKRAGKRICSAAMFVRSHFSLSFEVISQKGVTVGSHTFRK